jgi:hypothetical protein
MEIDIATCVVGTVDVSVLSGAQEAIGPPAAPQPAPKFSMAQNIDHDGAREVILTMLVTSVTAWHDMTKTAWYGPKCTPLWPKTGIWPNISGLWRNPCTIMCWCRVIPDTLAQNSTAWRNQTRPAQYGVKVNPSWFNVTSWSNTNQYGAMCRAAWSR